MSIVNSVLEGTTHKAALAYLNTLRQVYEEISPKVCDINWHLGRIADEYCNTSIEDSISIQRDTYDLLKILRTVEQNLESLEKAVNELAKNEASRMNVTIDTGKAEGGAE